MPYTSKPDFLSDNILFFNCYLAGARPILGHYQGTSLTHLMLITVCLHIRPDGQWEPWSEVGSLISGKFLVGLEQGAFQC